MCGIVSWLLSLDWCKEAFREWMWASLAQTSIWYGDQNTSAPAWRGSEAVYCNAYKCVRNISQSKSVGYEGSDVVEECTVREWCVEGQALDVRVVCVRVLVQACSLFNVYVPDYHLHVFCLLLCHLHVFCLPTHFILCFVCPYIVCTYYFVYTATSSMGCFVCPYIVCTSCCLILHRLLGMFYMSSRFISLSTLWSTILM